MDDSVQNELVSSTGPSKRPPLGNQTESNLKYEVDASVLGGELAVKIEAKRLTNPKPAMERLSVIPTFTVSSELSARLDHFRQSRKRRRVFEVSSVPWRVTRKEFSGS